MTVLCKTKNPVNRRVSLIQSHAVDEVNMKNVSKVSTHFYLYLFQNK